MTRNPFGWSLPPGCTQRDIDESFGHEDPCDCCGRFASDCICPECPVCGANGDPRCYGDFVHHGPDQDEDHKLVYNTAQLIGQTKLRIADLEQRLSDKKFALEQLEQEAKS